MLWKGRLKWEDLGGVWKLQLKRCCSISRSKCCGLTPNAIMDTTLTDFFVSESSEWAEFTLSNLFCYGELQSNILFPFLNGRCSLTIPRLQQPGPENVSWQTHGRQQVLCWMEKMQKLISEKRQKSRPGMWINFSSWRTGSKKKDKESGATPSWTIIKEWDKANPARFWCDDERTRTRRNLNTGVQLKAGGDCQGVLSVRVQTQEPLQKGLVNLQPSPSL